MLSEQEKNEIRQQLRQQRAPATSSNDRESKLQLIRERKAQMQQRQSSVMPQPAQRGIDNWANNVPVAKQVQDFGIGVGSAIGNTGLGLGQAAIKAGMGITSGLSKLTGGFLKYDNSFAQGVVDTLEKGKQAIYNKPFEANLQTGSGQAGTFAGNMAPYFAGGAPVQASKLALGTLAPRAVAALPYAGQDAVIAAGQSGGDLKTTVGTGAASLVANTILPGSGAPITQRILSGTASGYAGDVSMGLSGQRGEERTGWNAAIPGWSTVLGTGIGALSASPQIRQGLKDRGQQRTYDKRMQELTNLQQSNSRINRLFETADRSGVNVKEALSDSDLLAGAVTKEGRIDTRSPGMAVDKVDEMLAPYENKVGEALRAENKTVPITDVRDYLYKTIDDAGLLADVRTTARNRVDAIIGGLDNVIDENGNIPLSVVHDLKVQTNRLNAKSFQNPEANAVGKNIGRGLKELVENNTQALDVKGYNEDLRKFYALRNALFGMHGATVRGGRLGKYFSQTIGAIAGNAVGGPIGAVVGAEVGGALRGAQLQNKFGKGGTPIAPTARMQNVANEVGQSNNLGSRNTTQATTMAPTKNVIPSSKPQKAPLSSALPTAKNKTAQQGQMFAGGAAGFEMDENGNVSFSPEKALIGMAGMAGASKLYKTRVNPATVAKNIDSQDFKVINDFLEATQGTLRLEKALNDSRIKRGLKFLTDAGLDSDGSPEGITLARQYLQDVADLLPTNKGLVRKLPVLPAANTADDQLMREARKYKSAEEITDINKEVSVLRGDEPSKLGNGSIKRGDEYIDIENVVARERFNIPTLKKLSFGGSDRDVYDLGDGKVLKIAKSARGLAQNQMADWYAADQGLIPNIVEKGKNYVVFEKVEPPNAKTKAMVEELKKARQPVKSFYSNADRDVYFRDVDKYIEIMEKYGYPAEELRNYGDELLWGDMNVIRNWGTKDGDPILLDEGSLNGAFVRDFQESAKRGVKNLDDPEFREIYYISKELRKKYGDLDKKTMYGITGLGLLGASYISTKDNEKG